MFKQGPIAFIFLLGMLLAGQDNRGLPEREYLKNKKNKNEGQIPLDANT